MNPPQLHSVLLLSTTVPLFQVQESQSAPDNLANQLQNLSVHTTPDYRALNTTLLAMQRTAPLIHKLGLQKLLSTKDLFQICNFAQRVRQYEPFKPTYLKKDNSELGFSLIIDETATYIILKGQLLQDTFYPERKQGGAKRATWAIQLPTDANLPAARVCQLVSRDELSQAKRADLLEEYTLQTELAKEEICPNVLGVFDYTKTKKDGHLISKTVAFVEAFDDDLRAFDPGQTPPADGSDPRPFTLSHDQIVAIGAKIAQFTAKLHANNRLHGDLGLENVGICFDWLKKEITKIFLTDLGSSFTFTPGNKVHDLGKTYGQGYLSGPEFFRNDEVFNYPACDVYALGMLLSMLIVDFSKDVDMVFEPVWIDDLVTITQDAAEKGVEPTFFKPDGNPTDEIIEVLKLQEDYKTYSEASMLAIQNPPDAESFLKALIGIMLHPDPSRRPTAAEIASYFEAFKAKSNPPRV